jgi:hypothetical protein
MVVNIAAYTYDMTKMNLDIGLQVSHAQMRKTRILGLTKDLFVRRIGN